MNEIINAAKSLVLFYQREMLLPWDIIAWTNSLKNPCHDWFGSNHLEIEESQ